MSIDLRVGDCLDVLRELDVVADSVITDPPAAIAFMGRSWDTDRGGRGPWVEWLAERLAAARERTKPGGWAFVWALPRTAHWTGCAVEDAGWRIVDVVHHAFGQGWPKNRALLKPSHEHWILAQNGRGEDLQIDAARVRRDWSERGEAWLRSGHSAKPDAAKIGGAPPGNGISANPLGSWPPNQVLSHCADCQEVGTRTVKASGYSAGEAGGVEQAHAYGKKRNQINPATVFAGKDGTETAAAWYCLAACCACGASALAPTGGPAPACGACGAAMEWACPVAEVDAQSGYDTCRPGQPRSARAGRGWGQTKTGAEYADAGGASRFFPCLPGDLLRYHGKAPAAERDAGCEDLFWRANKDNPFGYDRIDRATYEVLPPDARAVGNVHPTVKRIAYLEWLCTVTTPPGGLVLDPFMGSGGTAIACHRRGLRFLGVDAAPEAVAIAEARLAWWRAVRLDAKPRKIATRSTDASAGPQTSLFARSA